MRFPYGRWVIDTGKTEVTIAGQLHLDGGALAVIHPGGSLVVGYAPGAWRSVHPAADPE